MVIANAIAQQRGNPNSVRETSSKVALISITFALRIAPKLEKTVPSSLFVQILNLKIEKLEQLVQLKDAKIRALSQQLTESPPQAT